MEVAQGIHRLGTYWGNWYLIADRGRFTLVDTGYAGYRDQFDRALAELGASPSDVEGIILTHHHTDHVGNAERLRRATSAPVFAHPLEAPLITGHEKPTPPRGLLANVVRPHVVRLLVHAIRNGGASAAPVAETTSMVPGEVLDVPGKPRVIDSPGHTRGHCSLLLEERDVVISADALVTLDLRTGERGPRIHAFNADPEMAMNSLVHFERLTVGTLLPGHGQPWTGDMASAVRLARENS